MLAVRVIASYRKKILIRSARPGTGACALSLALWLCRRLECRTDDKVAAKASVVAQHVRGSDIPLSRDALTNQRFLVCKVLSRHARDQAATVLSRPLRREEGTACIAERRSRCRSLCVQVRHSQTGVFAQTPSFCRRHSADWYGSLQTKLTL